MFETRRAGGGYLEFAISIACYFRCKSAMLTRRASLLGAMGSKSKISSPARVCIFGLLLALVGVHAGFLPFPPERGFPAYTITREFTLLVDLLR